MGLKPPGGLTLSGLTDRTTPLPSSPENREEPWTVCVDWRSTPEIQAQGYARVLLEYTNKHSISCIRYRAFDIVYSIIKPNLGVNHTFKASLGRAVGKAMQCEDWHSTKEFLASRGIILRDIDVVVVIFESIARRVLHGNTGARCKVAYSVRYYPDGFCRLKCDQECAHGPSMAKAMVQRESDPARKAHLVFCSGNEARYHPFDSEILERMVCYMERDMAGDCYTFMTIALNSLKSKLVAVKEGELRSGDGVLITPKGEILPGAFIMHASVYLGNGMHISKLGYGGSIAVTSLAELLKLYQFTEYSLYKVKC